jgi:hypothetical protein
MGLSDLDAKLRGLGRGYDAPGGQQEFSNEDATSEPDGLAPPPVSRSTALKLVVMAIVMIGLLLAVIVIFA